MPETYKPPYLWVEKIAHNVVRCSEQKREEDLVLAHEEDIQWTYLASGTEPDDGD